MESEKFMSVMDKYCIKGKVAVVTGGYGLYGKQISVALAEAGATVIIASRNILKCEELAEELRTVDLDAKGMELDLGSEESIVKLIKQVVDEYGRIDILVNNAVTREGFKNIEDLKKEDWEKSQLINSTGLMLITREAVAQMHKQKSGNIINISSIQGVVGPCFPVYGDTGKTSGINYTYDKWGMVGFTKWLANFYGKFGIRANCISPGGYDPDLTRDENNEFVMNYKRSTPLGRFANEEDIKGSIVFLASDASAYVTGHNLVVDGGWTSW
jgi:Dehydrogenases with different specificities (related to short-chain alcohol dehydrogenases)